MAHTFDDGILPVTFYADTDLTSYQYYLAVPASTEGYVKLGNGASVPTPIGVIQDDNASNRGDAVSVKCWGLTKARCAACTTAGEACDIDFGTHLVGGSDGMLYYAGSDPYNATAFGFLDSGCGYINVFLHGLSGSGIGAY